MTVSTVGVEASLAGKWVTQVRGSILDHLSPYKAMGVADRELTLAQLLQAVWPGGAGRAATAAGGCGGVHLDATDRVVQVLQSVQERGHGR